MPTGAIIENGTNANGTYVKFANGTLICYKHVIIASSHNSGSSFALPATYVDTNYVVTVSPSTMISTGGTASYVTEAQSYSVSSIKLKCVYVATGGTVGDTPNAPVSYQTIGRWY